MRFSSLPQESQLGTGVPAFIHLSLGQILILLNSNLDKYRLVNIQLNIILCKNRGFPFAMVVPQLDFMENPMLYKMDNITGGTYNN